MAKFNADNERVKRRYFNFLAQAKGSSEDTIDNIANAISRYEAWSKFQDFRRFHTDQASEFKRGLARETNRQTGEPLSLATIRSTLQALEAFFKWLSGQQGFKSALQWSDAEFFRMPRKDREAAKASRERPVPTLAQLHRMLEAMPASTDVEMRDRAVVAAAMVTGARDGALSSARLRHLDCAERVFYNDGRSMRTKFSKTFRSWFFPVGGKAEEILVEWTNHLRQNLCFGDDDPLFPSSRVGMGKSGSFETVGFKRECWSDASKIREIFRAACGLAGLPYFAPHSIRTTLGRMGQQVCGSFEQLKAWSQNLGHENIQTTVIHYGKLEPHRQAELIKGLTAEVRPARGSSAGLAAKLRDVLKELEDDGA